MSPKYLLVVVAALSVLGCDDPSPIFGGGWPPPSGGPIGSLGTEAFLIDDGEWVVSGNPVVEDFAPTGNAVHSATPIVVRFSESMELSTLANAFTINSENGVIPIPAAVNRVGDGRIFVLLPSLALTAGETYTVEIDGSALASDMTGEILSTTGILGQFTVADVDPDVPSLMFSWPADADIGMSAVGEVSVVFDRPMSSSSFNETSFSIVVDGTPPIIDPAPGPLSVLTVFIPTTDTRVWRWSSQDTSGVSQDLGADALVELALSPAGNELTDLDGGILATQTISFRTAEVSVPVAATITSNPSDAIGIANLTSGSASELGVLVDLLDGKAGDVIGLFVFGPEKTSDGSGGSIVAFESSVTLSSDAGTASFGLSDLGLLSSSSPLTARFADGALGFAFQVRRSGVTTPVRNLDVSAVEPGIQDPILDTVPPEILEIFGEDTFGNVTSDQRGLQLSGRASEQLRTAEVTTLLGSNGVQAAVLGARADGSFLSAPVAGIDVLSLSDMPMEWALTVFDRALNSAATPRTGSFIQRGVVGPAALVLGGNVDVEVYDAETLAPIPGARIYTHQNDGVAYALVASATTGGLGSASIASSVSGPTIVTVVADGYDLFSLVNVESTRVSVPLLPSVESFGDISGSVLAASDLASLTLATLTHRFDDSRRVPGTLGLFAGGTCLSNPFGGGELNCPFGPELLRVGRLGALSYLGGDFQLAEASFSAAASLQSFALALPTAPLAELEMQSEDLTVSTFNEPGVDALLLPVELPVVTLNAVGLVGVDLGSLVGNVGVLGDPHLSVETTVAGLSGSLAVGIGSAYSQAAGVWSLRAAVPGAVLPGGALAGTVDTDLFVKAAIVDDAGASSVRRVRLSDLPGLPISNQLDLIDAPIITTPLAGSSTGAAAFDVRFSNVLPDALGADALFVVEVTDSSNRAWRLFGRDPVDGMVPLVHLVDLGAQSETALAAGSLSARVRVIGGAGLDLGNLVWSDLERIFETTATGPSLSFNAP